jgi:hypothetical protein
MAGLAEFERDLIVTAVPASPLGLGNGSLAVQDLGTWAIEAL